MIKATHSSSGLIRRFASVPLPATIRRGASGGPSLRSQSQMSVAPCTKQSLLDEAEGKEGEQDKTVVAHSVGRDLLFSSKSDDLKALDCKRFTWGCRPQDQQNGVILPKDEKDSKVADYIDGHELYCL